MSISENNGRLPQERTLLEGIFHYLSILIVYRKFIFFTTLLAAVGVLIFSILSLKLPPERSPLPNQYLSSAKIIIDDDGAQNSINEMLAAMGMTITGTRADDPERLTPLQALTIQILNSGSFLDAIIQEKDMIRKYGMQDATQTKIRKRVLKQASFSVNREAGVLTVGYMDIDPEYARGVANSMVEELMEWFQGRSSITRSHSLELLEEKIAEVERTKVDLEERIKSLQEQYGMLSVEELAATQSEMLRELQSELILLERNIRNRNDLWRIKNDPELVRLRAEQDNIRQMIDQVKSGYTGGEQTLPSRSELPELSMHFARLQAELEIQRRIHTALKERYELLRISEGSSQIFSILELAEIPDEKAGPSRGLLSIQVTLGALAAGIVLSLLFHLIWGIASDPEKMGTLNQAIARNRNVLRKENEQTPDPEPGRQSSNNNHRAHQPVLENRMER